MARKSPKKHKVTRNGKTFWRGSGSGSSRTSEMTKRPRKRAVDKDSAEYLKKESEEFDNAPEADMSMKSDKTKHKERITFLRKRLKSATSRSQKKVIADKIYEAIKLSQKRNKRKRKKYLT